MNNAKCINIIKSYLKKNGNSESLEVLINGIEKENVLFLDLIPTDLIKDLMPESIGLTWGRTVDDVRHPPNTQ